MEGLLSTGPTPSSFLKDCRYIKTSLLRRLQAQTLPNATPPLRKIPPFTKIAVNFYPMKQFRCPLRFKFS